MIARSFINEVHCPYCGASLEVALQHPTGGTAVDYGILRCACHRYPIIEGIIVLQHHDSTILGHLENGDTESAFRAALYELVPSNARTRGRHVVDFLERLHLPFTHTLARHDADRVGRKISSEASLSFQRALRYLRNEAYGQYLFQRYANPSFLAGLAVLPVLKVLCESTRASKTAIPQRRRVLDLACGTAHTSFVMQYLFPDLSVVAVDHDFINLYLARRFLAPEATLLCVDVEAPLPFPDDAFEAVFCLDAFHYVHSKRALVREVDRIVEPQGIWLFPHLHNALVFNETAGIPLPPEAYLQCFSDVQPRLFTEHDLLQQLVHEPGIDLSETTSEASLQHSNALCLVGSRRNDLWHSYDNVTTMLCSDRSHLSLNPIYRSTSDGTFLRLQMAWPNARLEAECVTIKTYMPESYEIDLAFWNRLKNKATTEEDASDIEALAKTFVLVTLPQAYG